LGYGDGFKVNKIHKFDKIKPFKIELYFFLIVFARDFAFAFRKPLRKPFHEHIFFVCQHIALSPFFLKVLAIFVPLPF